MKRREFIAGATAGAVGTVLSRLGHAQTNPCPPETVQVEGGTSAITACVPPPQGTPLWLQGKALHQWVQLTGTRLSSVQAGFINPGGSLAYITAYSGGAVKASGSELFVIGGGHADYAGNEVYSIRLADNLPAWRRRNNPTQVVGTTAVPGVSHYSDGRPSSRHTYWSCQFINARDRLMTFGAAAVWGNGNGNFNTVDGFNPATNDYDPQGTYPSQDGVGAISVGVAVDASENVYVHNHHTGNLYKWTQATNAWSLLGNRNTYNYETAYACDTSRNRILRVRGNNGWSAGYFDLNNAAAVTNISFTGEHAAQIVSGSLVYDRAADCFWFQKRGSATLYRINPTTWAVTAQTITGSVPDNSYVDGRHNIYGRFNYCPQLKGLVFVKDGSNDVYFIRTA